MLNQVTLYFKWLILTAVLLSEPTHTLVFYPHLTIMTFTTYAAIFKQLIQEQYVLSLDKAGFFGKLVKKIAAFVKTVFHYHGVPTIGHYPRPD